MSSSPGPGNPYQAQFDPGAPAPAPKKSSLPLVLGIVAALSLIGLLVCCGGGYFLFSVGQNVVGAQITYQLRDNPEVQEKIGEIQSCSIDLAGIAAHPENQNNNSQQAVMVFKVVGTKGSGTLTADMDDSSGEPQYRPRELRLSTGETIRFQ